MSEDLRPIAEVAVLMGLSVRQARRRLHARAAVDARVLRRGERGRLLVDVHRLAELEGYSDPTEQAIEGLRQRVAQLEEVVLGSVRNGD